MSMTTGRNATGDVRTLRLDNEGRQEVVQVGNKMEENVQIFHHDNGKTVDAQSGETSLLMVQKHLVLDHLSWTTDCKELIFRTFIRADGNWKPWGILRHNNTNTAQKPKDIISRPDSKWLTIAYDEDINKYHFLLRPDILPLVLPEGLHVTVENPTPDSCNISTEIIARTRT